MTVFFESIHIDVLPQTYIESIATQVDRDDNDILSLKLKLEVMNVMTLDTPLKIKLSLVDVDNEVQLFQEDGRMVAKETGITEVTVSYVLGDVILWSYDNPYLYDIGVTITDHLDREVHTLSLPIGIRTLSMIGGEIILNEKKVSLKGVDLGFDDEAKDYEAYIKSLKAHNVNTVWTNATYRHSDFYDLCDRYGLMVIDQLIFDSEGCAKQVKERINHPSIIMWAIDEDKANKSYVVEVKKSSKSY